MLSETNERDRLRVLLVDPDKKTRETVRTLLKDDRAIGTVMECSNATECLSVIRPLKPDVVFMDVILPEMNAFLLLGRIDQSPFPQIIFLTGDHNYAVKAFEVAALDYLLKPCNEERLRKAIARAKNEISRVRTGSNAEKSGDSRRIVFNDGRKKIILEPNELFYVEAHGKFSKLNFQGKSLMLKTSISHAEQLLTSFCFVRIHRSVIVNIEHIRSLKPTPYRKTYDVVLKDGTSLTLSRKAALKRILT